MARERVILLVTAGTVLLFSLALMMYFARPTWRKYKDWRAENLAAEASAIMDTDLHRLKDAEALVKEAYELWPFDIDVMRVIARMYSIRGNYKNAFLFREKIYEMEGSVLDDKLMFIDSALKIRQFEKARDVLLELKKEYPMESPENLCLAIKVFNSVGDYDRSVREAVQLLKLDSDYPLEDVYFYTGHGLGPLENRREIPFTILNKMADRKDLLGLRVLRYLAGFSELNNNDRVVIATRLDEHPDADVEDRLLSYSLLIDAQEISHQDAVNGIREILKIESEEGLLRFGQWLNTVNLYEETLKHITDDVAAEKNSMFLLRLEALAGMKNWRMLRFMLKQDRREIKEHTRYLFRTQDYWENRLFDDAKNEWGKALFAVGRNVDDRWKMLDFSKKQGWNDLSAITLKDLYSLPFSRRAAANELVLLHYRNKDTLALFDTYKKLISDYPEEPDVLTGYCYMMLLLNQNVAVALSELSALFEAYPNNTAVRTSLALAFLKNNKPDDALNTVSGTSLNWLALSPSNQLIAATVLRSDGQRENADIILNNFNLDVLLPEEENLLKMY